jgi:hypothetical protein
MNGAALERALDAHFDRKYAEYCDMLDEQDDPECDDEDAEQDDE